MIARYKILYLLIKPYFIRIFLQNVYTLIVHDKKEQSYSIASKSQSDFELDFPNEIIKGGTFSNERFPINFAQSFEINSSQYLQKCCHISGNHSLPLCQNIVNGVGIRVHQEGLFKLVKHWIVF
jgi:hypothetical protein